jgi:hypothetical protein
LETAGRQTHPQMPSARSLLEEFLSHRTPGERYASFDYCYNYFHSFPEPSCIANAANLERSCMTLGFYLASWGMLRPRGQLLQRSARRLVEVIHVIASRESAPLWEIDAHSYSNQTAVRYLCQGYDSIAASLALGASKKLVVATKIMLGVFACVPAFDSRFSESMKWWCWHRHKFESFDPDAIAVLARFYSRHRRLIDCESRSIHTFAFNTGRDTVRTYTRAKIMDMIGFQARGREIRP